MLLFRKVMPPMSQTEKEAIDAGTTWWEGDLFRGQPDWQKLHSYPAPQLTAEEQAFLDGWQKKPAGWPMILKLPTNWRICRLNYGSSCASINSSP